MKLLLSVILLMIGFQQFSFAQNDFESFTTDENILKYLKQDKFDIDKDANAVMILDKSTKSYNSIFSNKVEQIIKIINVKGAEDLLTFSISGHKSTTIKGLKAITYNLENGVVTKDIVSKDQILADETSNVSKSNIINLSNVKNGSLITISYIVETKNSNMDWYFQTNYPVLNSVYALTLPEVIMLLPNIRSSVPIKTVKSKKDIEQIKCDACYYEKGFGEQLNKERIWVRRNIPAFKSEPYSPTMNNLIENIEMSILGTAYKGVVKGNVSWEIINENEYFNNENTLKQAFNANPFLKDKVEEIVKNQNTNLEKAKAIYYYIQNNYENNNNLEYFYNLKNVFTEKQGSKMAINTLLVAMLRKVGLESYPIILATKGQGKLNELNPTINKVNALAVLVNIDGQDVILEGTTPYLKFGNLPLDYYNGYSRFVSKEGGPINLSTELPLEKSVQSISINYNESTNKFDVVTSITYGTYVSMILRSNYKKDSLSIQNIFNADVYNKEMYAKDASMNFRFLNMDKTDELLKCRIEKSIDIQNVNQFIMDAVLISTIEKNILGNVADRKHPIEFPYRRDIQYNLTLNLGNKFTLLESPTDNNLSFGAPSQISYVTNTEYNKDINMYSLKIKYQSFTNSFSQEDAKPLSDFFNDIIKLENKKIILNAK